MKVSKRHIVLSSLGICLLCLGVLAYGIYFTPAPSLWGKTSFSAAYYDRNNTLLRLTLSEDESYRLYTPLEEISPELIEATLLQEDRYFYTHPGVNPVSLLRGAYATYIRRSRSIGGSTISMQVVRLRDQMQTQDIWGKLIQIYQALRLDAHYSKKDILEAYLNLAPYGGNIYGAGTASLIYFKQPVKTLPMPQSLALAVIPQNPVKRYPLRADNSPWQQARKRLFNQFPANKYEQYAPYIGMKITAFSRDDLPFLAPHFIDDLEQESQEGRIETTLDISLQQRLEGRIQSYLQRKKHLGIDNAAAMLLHFPTMEVRALVGSGDFFNAAIQGQVDGTLARRSPGSTLKPFVYALGLEQGLIHPETLLEDDKVFFAEYRPGNFDKRFIGKIPAREALILSRNIPAISLAYQLRDPDLYQFLQTAEADFPQNRKHYGLSIVVGGAEITMRKLVQLYAMLANGGKLNDLKYRLDQPVSGSRDLLSPEAALLTVNMMQQSKPDTLPFTPNSHRLPHYWKTGTSNGFRDAWTIGIFGPYVLAVWTGHFDGHANPSLIGSQAAAPLFFDIANTLTSHARLKDYIAPAIEQTKLAHVSICRKTGEIGSCSISKESLFIPGKSPFQPIKSSKKTEILSPRENISYSYSHKNNDLRIPLEARSTEINQPLFWFANNVFIGTSQHKTPLFWSPKPGEHVVRVVDSNGIADIRHINVIISE